MLVSKNSFLSPRTVLGEGLSGCLKYPTNIYLFYYLILLNFISILIFIIVWVFTCDRNGILLAGLVKTNDS